MPYPSIQDPPSPPNEALTKVCRADHARYRAMLDNDLTALERLLSRELTYTHASAHTETKSEYLESLRSGRIKYLEADRGDISTRSYGDTVVMQGNVLLKAIVDGQPRMLDNVFLSVWTQDADQWQMVAWASTPKPAK